MQVTNYAHSAAELVRMYDRATTERGYVPESFCAIPAGVDNLGNLLTQVTWKWEATPLPESIR